MVTGSAAPLAAVSGVSPPPPGLQLPGGRAPHVGSTLPDHPGTGVPPNLVPEPSAFPRPSVR